MKITIKGIVKENKEDLLVDRVVESLLGDTTYEVYHRFMGEIICEVRYPMYEGTYFYNSHEIKTNLNLFKQKEMDVIGLNYFDYKYMDQNYGITDETILRRIYLKYYTILFTKILNDFDNYERKPMNESKENKEDILVDKISQYMIEDTYCEYNQRGERIVILYPFYNVENYYSLENVLRIILKRGYDLDFVNYVQNTYGIKDWNLIVNISQRYYSLLYDKVKEMLGSISNPINESVERKEGTLNRIVDFMIEDTKWDVHMEHEDDWEYVEVSIYWPGGDRDDYKLFDMEVEWDMFHTGERDIDYIKNNFGI
jgi:acetolactate synthase regulatory subunit